jgi:hypothetical protein
VTPATLVQNPGHALVGWPGSEDNTIALKTAQKEGLPARSLSSTVGRTDGDSRWDVEYWWRREAEGPLRLVWPVGELDAELGLEESELLNAAAKVESVD